MSKLRFRLSSRGSIVDVLLYLDFPNLEVLELNAVFVHLDLQIPKWSVDMPMPLDVEYNQQTYPKWGGTVYEWLWGARRGPSTVIFQLIRLSRVTGQVVLAKNFRCSMSQAQLWSQTECPSIKKSFKKVKLYLNITKLGRWPISKFCPLGHRSHPWLNWLKWHSKFLEVIKRLTLKVKQLHCSWSGLGQVWPLFVNLGSEPPGLDPGWVQSRSEPSWTQSSMTNNI